MRACLCHERVGFEVERWGEVSRIYRRLMGMALGRKSGRAELKGRVAVTKNTEEMLVSKENETVLPDMGSAAMLLRRVRYFTDGAVIGSKSFVNEVFTCSRERFPSSRKDGARRMRGGGPGGAVQLWSMRDLRV